jgi:Fe-Mn family superoxide dismutase
MTPNGGGLPTGDLLLQLKLLWNFEEFQVSAAGATQFGSGWAWLCVHKGEN